MKLKKLCGVIVATLATLCMSAFAYAADGEFSVKIGKPLSGVDFSEKTELKAGECVFIPVDFSSKTGNVKSLGARVRFNKEYLSQGFDVSTDAGMDAAAYALENSDSKFAMILGAEGTDREFCIEYLDGYGSVNRLTKKFTAFGKPTFIVTNGDLAGYGTADKDAHPDSNVELYICFTVLKDVDVNSLNMAYVTEVDTPEILDATENVGHLLTPDEVSVEKLNACYGAFNVVVTPADLTSYIQELFVSIGGKAPVKITKYKEDGDNLVFPVRVTTNTTGTTASVDVTVTATTTSDLDGTKDEKTGVEMGTATITLNSPTSYEPGVTVK